ncbi:MAG: UDP-N-acetylmuramoyl-tripeptide--D-alanyl-D-alanine ligase [Jatrophihabitans sp.]
MIEMTLGEIASIVDGQVIHADSATMVTGPVEFDSRAVVAGGLFLALPGERVDGHDYVDTALAAGAVAALVTRDVDAPAVLVADGFAALAALASFVVRSLPELTVIGITGSSGKTSTKDLVAQLLATAGPTIAPPGSFNNELGHPYTVLRATTDTRFLVLEKSARGIGHIRYLTNIAPPRIGVVLNVGSAHLGEFGSREAIAQAKGELVEALPVDGVAILNADDALVAAMAVRTKARVVTFGEAADADVRAEEIQLDDLGRARFVLRAAGVSVDVALRLVGPHHVSNALAAAAVAVECGMTPNAVAAQLSAATPLSRWRMEVTERADGVLILNDAYNANPESMRAALVTLADFSRTRRTWAVLGPMGELGEAEQSAHEAVGRLAAELGIAQLIAVGEPARPIVAAATLEGSWGGEARSVADVSDAVTLLSRELRRGDVVLVKASRAARLERIALGLAEDSEPGSDEKEGSAT